MADSNGDETGNAGCDNCGVKDAATGGDWCLQCAYDLGHKDGMESPEELASGMTWDNSPALNDAYDMGVNAGQAAGKAAVAG